jgi:hypothetical protein
MDLPVAEGRGPSLDGVTECPGDGGGPPVGALGGANSRQGVSCGAQEPIVVNRPRSGSGSCGRYLEPGSFGDSITRAKR